ncbi:hypothetical protein Tco_1086801, partial [Tanacetum coccineum]
RDCCSKRERCRPPKLRPETLDNHSQGCRYLSEWKDAIERQSLASATSTDASNPWINAGFCDIGNHTEHMIAATSSLWCRQRSNRDNFVNHSLSWESVVYCMDWLPVCMYDLHLKPLFTRSISCNLGTVKNVQLADKKSHMKIQCPNEKTMGHNQQRSTAIVGDESVNLGNITSHLANENGRPRLPILMCMLIVILTHQTRYALKLAMDNDHLANSNGHATLIEETIVNSVFAPFDICENCGNQPSNISCSSITTFVPTRLQELHFNSPEQYQLNKRNGKFTEDGIQKAFAKVKTMANKHISDYTTSTITSNVCEQKKSH